MYRYLIDITINKNNKPMLYIYMRVYLKSPDHYNTEVRRGKSVRESVAD